MYLTVIKLIWPLLERLLAKQAAEYLEERRDRRRQTAQVQEPSVDCPPCPPVDRPVVAEGEAPSDDSIWFALSGILLGSAFSLMLYVMLQDDRTHL